MQKDLKAYNDDVAQIVEKLQLKEVVIETLKSDLESKEKEIELLREQNETMLGGFEAERESMERIAQEREWNDAKERERIEKLLRFEISTKEKEIEGLCGMRVGEQSKLTSSLITGGDKVKLIKMLRQKMKTAETKSKRLEAECKAKFKAVKVVVANSNETLMALRKRIATQDVQHRKDISRLQQQIEHQRTEKEAMSIALHVKDERMESTIIELKKKNAELKLELIKEKNDKNENMAQCRLQQVVTRKDEELRLLKGTLKDRNETLATLRTCIGTKDKQHGQEVSRLQQQIEHQNTEIEAISKVLEDNEQGLETAICHQQELQKAMSKTGFEVQSAKDEMSHAKDKEIERLRIKLMNQDRELDLMQKARKKIDDQLQHKDMGVLKCLMEIKARSRNQMEKKLDSYSAVISASESVQSDKTKSERALLAESLVKLEMEQLTAFQQKEKEYLQKIRGLQRKVEMKNVEAETLKKKLEVLEQQLIDAEDGETLELKKELKALKQKGFSIGLAYVLEQKTIENLKQEIKRMKELLKAATNESNEYKKKIKRMDANRIIEAGKHTTIVGKDNTKFSEEGIVKALGEEISDLISVVETLRTTGIDTGEMKRRVKEISEQIQQAYVKQSNFGGGIVD